MIQIYINDLSYQVKSSISILEACKLAGINIKRFCYHEALSVSGNCRMCLVEIVDSKKVMASCVTEVEPNMEVYTDTPHVKKLRENVLESLLINHPLDCPICDQGGECDLQDQAKVSGKIYSKFYFNKRGVEDKSMGPLIKTVMTRCIHCTRCVRYSTEIAGTSLGTLGRGVSTEIGFYTNKFFNSEISGNVLDLCPVGALTAKPYAFKSRPWELISEESIDLLDGLGSNIYFNTKQTEIVRVLPKSNNLINDSFISDKVRFFFDSLSKNRLRKVFSKHSDLGLSIKNFKKQIYLVVDETCSVDYLVFLKKLSYIDSRIKVVKQNNLNIYSNFYINKKNTLNNFLLNLNSTCLIVSSNLRLENAIINAKIRAKYNNENIDFIGTSLKFNSTFPVNFISLNIKDICRILEGKHSLLSKLFFVKKLSIILGKYSEVRFYNNLEHFLKSINNNINVLTIELYCNTIGSELLNIKPLALHSIKKSAAVFISLDDTFNVRSIFKESTNFLVWLNSFGSVVASKSDAIIPIESLYEENGIFINLEGRAQITNTSKSNVSSFKMALINLFSVEPLSIFKKETKYVNFLIEMSNLSKNLPISIFNQSLLSKFSLNKILLKKGAFKSSIEDFYCSDLITKNSKTLASCSQHVRSSFINF